MAQNKRGQIKHPGDPGGGFGQCGLSPFLAGEDLGRAADPTNAVSLGRVEQDKNNEKQGR
jgi:hypothetical protein